MTDAPADQITATLVALQLAGIPTDVQELLVRGNPDRGVAPGALAKALTTQSALIETLTRERDEARERAAELEKLVIWSADEKHAAEAALADARNKALEEAATEAMRAYVSVNLADRTPSHIGRAIRALKSA